MPDFKEELLQFAWRHKLMAPGPYLTAGGKSLHVIHPGEPNRDAGPDFFSGRIKIDNLELVGNIEIHIKSSHWLKHGHQSDRCYDNIILHVVYENDVPIQQNLQHNVEVLELKNILPAHLVNNYREIVLSGERIACSAQLPSVADLKFTAWLQRMFVERLEKKVKNLESVFESHNGDYVQTFYTLLLRNFGFKVNALPFEMLSKQLPCSILLRHSDNILQLEALLLGSAGLLDRQLEHPYVLKLQNEFEFLKNKYHITPMDRKLFKFSRLRPANFASLRLAQLAGLIHSKPEILSAADKFDSHEKISAAFTIELSQYWKNHYNVEGPAVQKELHLGRQSVENIMINTFAPFFFFYHKKTGAVSPEKIPLALLEKCAFEKNFKTKLFAGKRSLLKTGADGQALIHLHDHYCTKKQCLSCGIGAAVLGRK